MPKGFSRKAIKGFTKWMVAILDETSIDKLQLKNTINKTKKLLDEGFPKAR